MEKWYRNPSPNVANVIPGFFADGGLLLHAHVTPHFVHLYVAASFRNDFVPLGSTTALPLI
jgi:hypothetical protein